MKGVLEKIFPWSLFSIGIILVVKDQLIVPFILLAFISSIPFWKKLTFSKSDLPLYGLIGLYLMYVLWLAFSVNFDYGRRDVESKLSFLIFPLIFLFSGSSWKQDFTRKVKDGLIIGVLLSMCISFGRALFCKWNGGEICFRNDQFGFNMHATYLSLMYLFAVILVLERKLIWNGSVFYKLIYSLLALLAIYYMRSLSTLLAMVVIVGLGVMWWMVKTRKWKWLLTIPVFLLLAWFAIQRVPSVMSDFHKTIATVQEYNRDPDAFVRTHTTWNESNTVRIIVWKFSSELIASQPTGVGTGDVKDELFRVYRSHGYDLFAEKELNSHDQFLQTGVALGVTGIFLLIFIFLTSFKRMTSTQDEIMNAFLILTLITCFFESYLERQVGIIFFSFFLSALITDWKFRKLRTDQ